MVGNVKAVPSLSEYSTIQRLNADEEEEGKYDEEEDDDDEEEEEDCDKGQICERRWLIVLAGMTIYALATLATSCFGILFSPRLLELGESEGYVVTVANAAISAANLLCLPMTPVLHRWGCRRLLLPLVLVYSAAFTVAAAAFTIPGLFAAAAFVAGSVRQIMLLVVQVAVCRCFKRGRPLAMGITVAGSSITQILGPPLIAFMQSRFTPRTVLLMTSILMLHMCIAVAVMPSGSGSSKPRRVNYLAILRKQQVVLTCLGVGICTTTLAAFWISLPMVLYDSGLSSREVALLLSIAGVANLIGKIVCPLLCYLLTAGAAFRLFTFLSAAILPMWYWYERLLWRVAYMYLNGLLNGMWTVQSNLLILEVAGLHMQAEALSFMTLFIGISMMFIGQALDLIRVMSGSSAFKLHAISFVLMLTLGLWKFLSTKVYEVSSSSSSHAPTLKGKKTRRRCEESRSTLKNDKM